MLCSTVVYPKLKYHCMLFMLCSTVVCTKLKYHFMLFMLCSTIVYPKWKYHCMLFMLCSTVVCTKLKYHFMLFMLCSTVVCTKNKYIVCINEIKSALFQNCLLDLVLYSQWVMWISMLMGDQINLAVPQMLTSMWWGYFEGILVSSF
jgi:hypothetical protein